MRRPADISAEAVDRYGRLVLKAAYRILPDSDDAQEVFQETFLGFHAACARGETISHPKAWLCRVAANAAFDIRRHRHRARMCEDTPADARPDKEAERRMLLDRVRDLAAELPERQRMVFALRNFEGLPFAEIAARLGCSEESARASEYKALKKIRACMGADSKDQAP